MAHLFRAEPLIEIALAAGQGLPESPRGQAGRACVRPRPRHRVAAVPTHLQNDVTAGRPPSVPPASSRNTAVRLIHLSQGAPTPWVGASPHQTAIRHRIESYSLLSQAKEEQTSGARGPAVEAE